MKVRYENYIVPVIVLVLGIQILVRRQLIRHDRSRGESRQIQLSDANWLFSPSR